MRQLTPLGMNCRSEYSARSICLTRDAGMMYPVSKFREGLGRAGYSSPGVPSLTNPYRFLWHLANEFQFQTIRLLFSANAPADPSTQLRKKRASNSKACGNSQGCLIRATRHMMCPETPASRSIGNKSVPSYFKGIRLTGPTTLVPSEEVCV